MNNSMTQVQELLRSQLAPLNNQAAELERELSILDQDRKRLQAALTSIEGGPAKSKGKSARKCVTKDIVIQLIEQILNGSSPLLPDELDQKVRSKVKELGYSLSGITLRIKEALKERQFGRTTDGKFGVRKAMDVPIKPKD